MSPLTQHLFNWHASFYRDQDPTLLGQLQAHVIGRIASLAASLALHAEAICRAAAACFLYLSQIFVPFNEDLFQTQKMQSLRAYQECWRSLISLFYRPILLPDEPTPPATSASPQQESPQIEGDESPSRTLLNPIPPSEGRPNYFVPSLTTFDADSVSAQRSAATITPRFAPAISPREELFNIPPDYLRAPRNLLSDSRWQVNHGRYGAHGSWAMANFAATQSRIALKIAMLKGVKQGENPSIDTPLIALFSAKEGSSASQILYNSIYHTLLTSLNAMDNARLTVQAIQNTFIGLCQALGVAHCKDISSGLIMFPLNGKLFIATAGDFAYILNNLFQPANPQTSISSTSHSIPPTIRTFPLTRISQSTLVLLSTEILSAVNERILTSWIAEYKDTKPQTLALNIVYTALQTTSEMPRGCCVVLKSGSDSDDASSTGSWIPVEEEDDCKRPR